VTVGNNKRRRTVILSADVKDDDRLLGGDEAETLKVLTAHYDVTTTLIQQHHGRLLDSAGDNILAEFAGAVDAVQGAVAIQKLLATRNGYTAIVSISRSVWSVWQSPAVSVFQKLFMTKSRTN
jgi:class 3 adenylate cyclase